MVGYDIRKEAKMAARKSRQPKPKYRYSPGYPIMGGDMDLDLRNPDDVLLLMDVLMPKMSGLAALKEIIEHDSNAKVIMMSALDRSDLKEEALKVGVKHFLFKPFQMDELLVTIEKVLKQ